MILTLHVAQEQTKDLAELLIALRAIESLHRQLGRKLRWFVEEGCDWPRVAKFGKLYEDMAQEFHGAHPRLCCAIRVITA